MSNFIITSDERVHNVERWTSIMARVSLLVVKFLTLFLVTLVLCSLHDMTDVVITTVAATSLSGTTELISVTLSSSDLSLSFTKDRSLFLPYYK